MAASGQSTMLAPAAWQAIMGYVDYGTLLNLRMVCKDIYHVWMGQGVAPHTRLSLLSKDILVVGGDEDVLVWRMKKFLSCSITRMPVEHLVIVEKVLTELGRNEMPDLLHKLEKYACAENRSRMTDYYMRGAAEANVKRLCNGTKKEREEATEMLKFVLADIRGRGAYDLFMHLMSVLNDEELVTVLAVAGGEFVYATHSKYNCIRNGVYMDIPDQTATIILETMKKVCAGVPMVSLIPFCINHPGFPYGWELAYPTRSNTKLDAIGKVLENRYYEETVDEIYGKIALLLPKEHSVYVLHAMPQRVNKMILHLCSLLSTGDLSEFQAFAANSSNYSMLHAMLDLPNSDLFVFINKFYTMPFDYRTHMTIAQELCHRIYKSPELATRVICALVPHSGYFPCTVIESIANSGQIGARNIAHIVGAIIRTPIIKAQKDQECELESLCRMAKSKEELKDALQEHVPDLKHMGDPWDIVDLNYIVRIAYNRSLYLCSTRQPKH